MQALNERVAELLGPFDHLRLECDGFVRIASHVLRQNSIQHSVYAGSAAFRGGHVFHFWIEFPDESGKVWTADYRLRMWLGQDAPHGVFENNGQVEYNVAGECTVEMSQELFEILTGTRSVFANNPAVTRG